jgi:hypothetical protein
MKLSAAFPKFCERMGKFCERTGQRALARNRTAVSAQLQDRPIVKERVEHIKEHRPVEKEVSTGTQRCSMRGCVAQRPAARAPACGELTFTPMVPAMQFVVETRATGVEREATEGRVSENLGTTERIVSEAKPRSPCD